MSVSRLALLLGCVPATAWRASRSPLLCHSLRKMSSQGEKSKPVKQSLKKPKLPEGRFDAPEDSNLEKEPLTIASTTEVLTSSKSSMRAGTNFFQTPFNVDILTSSDESHMFFMASKW
ncbi:succinate dehydrogenase assembly factor 4, mitochondrial isoform X1 [Ursus maritimus]|uniref:Succinate dehydrogenase assembly factor 4, mitochondrial isoform X1 n=1 Tax=Ursus maritimus TaxID=29073 RepID=A0A8M1GXI7_URSMA|nr:succinate dehydrogenase assembly factor 4, mitochondrial isoform X1 [Ursus maritimus]